jgi:hypothetical protein
MECIGVAALGLSKAETSGEGLGARKRAQADRSGVRSIPDTGRGPALSGRPSAVGIGASGDDAAAAVL